MLIILCKFAKILQNYHYINIIILKRILQIFVLIACLVQLTSCQVALWSNDNDNAEDITISIERYDMLQSRYLTNCDFSALQSMNTDYAMETRTLIENMLQLGTVDQYDINKKLLAFYQDSTLQTIIRDVNIQYASTNDLNENLTAAFKRLAKILPELAIPKIYTQIGALGESIIVGDGMVGICLDKYLGSDYAVYHRYYPEYQRETMTRDNIVPDCLLFYILSKYPLADFEHTTQQARDQHIGRVMYIVNQAMGKKYFNMQFVNDAEKLMKKNKGITAEQLLSQTI